MAVGRLAQDILNEMAKATKNEAGRKELLRVNGQLLIIDIPKFKAIIKDIFPELDSIVLQRIWKDWRLWLLTQSKNVKGDRLEELLNYKAQIKLKRSERIFIIGAYNTVRKEKSGNGTLGTIVKKHVPKASDKSLEKLSGKDNIHGAQLGHEEAGRGVATSGIKSLKAQRVMEQGLSSLKTNEQAQFVNLFAQTNATLGIKMQHVQVIDASTGQLRKDYIPVLTWQGTLDNREQIALEAAANRELTNELKDLATMEGSTPLTPALGESFLHLLSKGAPNSKTTGKKRKAVKEKSSASKRKKVTKKTKVPVVRDGGVDSKSFSTGKSSGGSGKSYLSLIGLINAKLPKTVLENMGSPALESRTGTFASSVRATDVLTTPQGYPSIGYTYQQNPYRIFEVGTGRAPWASQERDPRKLIDRSIREIATELVIGRFYTRRV